MPVYELVSQAIFRRCVWVTYWVMVTFLSEVKMRRSARFVSLNETTKGLVVVPSRKVVALQAGGQHSVHR